MNPPLPNPLLPFYGRRGNGFVMLLATTALKLKTT